MTFLKLCNKYHYFMGWPDSWLQNTCIQVYKYFHRHNSFRPYVVYTLSPCWLETRRSRLQGYICDFFLEITHYTITTTFLNVLLLHLFMSPLNFIYCLILRPPPPPPPRIVLNIPLYTRKVGQYFATMSPTYHWWESEETTLLKNQERIIDI